MQLANYKVVGFTGSRKVGQKGAILAALSRVAPTAQIYVGDATGVDAMIRKYASQRIRVFTVEDPRQRRSYAQRSIKMITELNQQEGRILIAFPATECPPKLQPCKDPFKGYGSGTWATAALAAHLNIPVILHGQLPSGWSGRALDKNWSLIQSLI